MEHGWVTTADIWSSQPYLPVSYGQPVNGLNTLATMTVVAERAISHDCNSSCRPLYRRPYVYVIHVLLQPFWSQTLLSNHAAPLLSTRENSTLRQDTPALSRNPFYAAENERRTESRSVAITCLPCRRNRLELVLALGSLADIWMVFLD